MPRAQPGAQGHQCCPSATRSDLLPSHRPHRRWERHVKAGELGCETKNSFAEDFTEFHMGHAVHPPQSPHQRCRRAQGSQAPGEQRGYRLSASSSSTSRKPRHTGKYREKGTHMQRNDVSPLSSARKKKKKVSNITQKSTTTEPLGKESSKTRTLSITLNLLPKTKVTRNVKYLSKAE